MENATKPQRYERFYLQILNNNRFETLMGKVGVCYFPTREAARAYMPTVLANVACDGIRIQQEAYWK